MQFGMANGLEGRRGSVLRYLETLNQAPRPDFPIVLTIKDKRDMGHTYTHHHPHTLTAMGHLSSHQIIHTPSIPSLRP